jgi:hypothetical protein
MLSFLAPFFCLSLSASLPGTSAAESPYNQECYVTYRLGFLEFPGVRCDAAKALFEKMLREDRFKKETVKHVQVCFVGKQGAKQCAIRQENTPCKRAIELIESALLVSKK